MREHARGGASHRDNLETECAHHHRLRHERGFTTHRLYGGTYLWQAPNGMIYGALPRPNLVIGGFADPPIPPGFMAENFPDEPLEDAYGRP